MSRRGGLVDYAGAGAQGRLTISDVLRLPASRYGVMPKADGWYVHVHLDRRGRIERLLTRTGGSVPMSLAADFIGCHVGAPDSVLVGELEAGETGNRAAARRGYRVIELFDIVRVDGRYVAREPFRVRRDWLYRSQSWAENMGDRRHFEMEGPRARHKRSGRFCPAVPRTWERTPILPIVAPGQAGDLWEAALVGEVEGAVVCALDAPMNRRNAKRKLRPVGTLDAAVIKIDCGGVLVHWIAGDRYIALGHRRGVAVRVGETVELEFNGWTGDGPRFPRLRRVRADVSV